MWCTVYKEQKAYSVKEAYSNFIVRPINNLSSERLCNAIDGKLKMSSGLFIILQKSKYLVGFHSFTLKGSKMLKNYDKNVFKRNIARNNCTTTCTNSIKIKKLQETEMH